MWEGAERRCSSHSVGLFSAGYTALHHSGGAGVRETLHLHRQTMR